MSLCCKCDYAVHEQYRGYTGRWICMHPCRYEISNAGEFTYPGNISPATLICDTPAVDFSKRETHLETLKKAATPKWCYYEVVARSQVEQPGFNPDVQRSILWPEKVLPKLKPLREENNYETSSTS